MAGIKGGKLTGEGGQLGSMRGILNYQLENAIQQPFEIRLEDKNLVWDTGYSYSLGEGWNLTRKPIDGCLSEFLRLDGATSKEILLFANQRGVLGIRCSASIETEGLIVYTRYVEPVSVYLSLAKEAKKMICLARKLREGSPITGVDLGDWSFSKTREGYYVWINILMRKWWAGTSLKISPAFSHMNAATIEQSFSLSFGEWVDGFDWDKNAQLNLSDLSKYPSPSGSQRPSPLFNVLAFQLLAAVTLPAGRYFCAECGKLFEPDPNRNKPRKDKSAYCTEDCRHNAEMRMDRERKRKKAAEKTPDEEKQPTQEREQVDRLLLGLRAITDEVGQIASDFRKLKEGTVAKTLADHP